MGVAFGEVDVEQVAEGVAVGHLEHAVRADQDVHVERVDVGAENALLTAARRGSASSSEVAGWPGVRSVSSRAMNSPRWMFSMATSRMKSWWAMWWSKVISASRPDGVDRVDVVDLQALLGLADAAVGVLQHRQVELFLAAEVVVDHPLGGAGLLGDLVDAGARVALLGEHRGGHLDQLGARALGVAQRLGARLGGHNPQLTARSPL